MGQQSNKYHISDEGDVFRINEDGSFTEIGKLNNICQPLRSSQSTPDNKHSGKKWIFIIIFVYLLLVLLNVCLDVKNVPFEQSDQIQNKPFDSEEYFNSLRNEMSWYRDSINDYDKSIYSLTADNINEAVNIFYDESGKYCNKYKEVERRVYNAASKDNPEAQYLLGCIYANGGYGIKRSFSLAFYWFEKAALNGHVKSMYYLARDYYVSRDAEKAHEWMHKAADKGDWEAMYFGLGHGYENGTFSEPNLQAALYWYKRFDEISGHSNYWLVNDDIERIQTKIGNGKNR